MSKQSQRPNREEIKSLNKERKEAQKVLRAKQRGEGMTIPIKPSIPNRKSQYVNVEEEQVARQFAATEQARIFQSQLPGLLKTISKIKDLRNPKKIKHKLDLLIMYGILIFVFQMASRREANREITLPQFMESLMPIRLPQNRRILHDSVAFLRPRKRPCSSAIPLSLQFSAHCRNLPLARNVC